MVTAFMQDSAPCSAHRARATQDDLRNFLSDFAVEKTSGSTAVVTKQRISVERLLRLLVTLFFLILTCNITFLKSRLK